MKILVTGSSGHLGEALMRTLRAQGRAVEHVQLAEGFPDPSPAQTRHAIEAMCAIGTDVPLIIDGLALVEVHDAHPGGVAALLLQSLDAIPKKARVSIQGRGRARLLYDRQHAVRPGCRSPGIWENPAAPEICIGPSGTNGGVRRLLTFTIC